MIKFEILFLLLVGVIGFCMTIIQLIIEIRKNIKLKKLTNKKHDISK